MSGTFRVAPTTILDAWTRFSDLHGSEAPIRMMDDLLFVLNKFSYLEYGNDVDMWNFAFDVLLDDWAWNNCLDSAIPIAMFNQNSPMAKMVDVVTKLDYYNSGTFAGGTEQDCINTARAWRFKGFTPDQVLIWGEAGFWCENIAASARDALLTPQQATNACIDAKVDIYDVCNGDEKVPW